MGERNWNSHRSKEDLTQKISKSIFVTNFPDHISIRDLWGTYKAYGTAVDVYIPYKKSKAGDALFYDNDNNKSKESNVQSEDPFNIYDLLSKNKENNGNSKEGELKYPPGFTPKETSVNEVHKKEIEAPSEEVKQNSYNSVRNNSLNASYYFQRFKARGLGHKTKKGWIKELCTKNRVNFVSLQETKMEHIELVTINKLWGNSSYDYTFSSSLAICLDKYLSDRHPILIREMNIDYGPTPFRFFNSWFQIEGGSNEMILNDRSILLKELHDIIYMDLEEMAQKAKVHWAIEGDENSKYFHGILNNKRTHLAIRGVLVNGDWIVKPNDVKNEFLNHFSSQFDRHVSHRICLADVFNNQLSLEQQDDLERTISIEEIKRAMWDYGTNKSPVPDVFTFEFFRRYWKFLENDILGGVMKFFSSGTFPKGCNSSFIALIPKTQNANTVKYFHPMSLIRSLYKIIAKILANKLSYVILDLISDVQSAFISNRQILDGPFILNELLSWYDAIFVRKWDSSNLKIILKVLKCFHMASGLKININKSKLMGYGAHSDEVEISARYIGCATFVVPFSYLGVKVGGRMERINLWDDVVSKVTSWLSKWKLKMLSIGGWLTLIKSILTSIPLYQMSSFKVPIKVLNILESIRRKFFNGIERNERKLALISWDTVLVSKKYGGLGVSSFFAMNRALLSKWVWRFLSQTSSL
nr:RNA-directed DNA polymerase, eukaryota [Tanacetum cinerariifolium]